MTNTVIGVYDSFAHAQSAKQKLLASGFTNNDVRLHSSTTAESADTTAEVRTNAGDHESEGFGSTISAFFRDIFGSSSDTGDGDRYAEAARRGSVVLTVDANDDNRRDLAASIMEQFDPIDIEERANGWQAAGWKRYDPSAAPLTQEEILHDRNAMNAGVGKAGNVDTTIPVIAEELKVGKRQVQGGGIRVVKRVLERPVNETIGLREEHVTIERHAVNTPATVKNIDNFKEETFELREMAEEAVVSKTARVVEEVVIGKEVSEKQKTISDTVRQTDVEVVYTDTVDDIHHGAPENPNLKR